jgi:hypothetical protein
MNRRRLSSAAVWVVASALATLAHAQDPLIVVRGEANCPSADMIRAALHAILAEGAWPAETLVVEVAGDRLLLRLGGDPGVRREIPADRDCAVRAGSVALILAAWSGELLSLPANAPVLDAAAPATMAPAIPTAQVAATAPAGATAPTHYMELDGGGFYSPVWGHAGGTWLGIGLTPVGGGLGFRAIAVYQAARDVALEGGTTQILRAMLGAAATYDIERKQVFASGGVGLVGTLTHAAGLGYEPNRAVTEANVGGFGDLRVGLPLGRLRIWTDVRLLRLLVGETVKIQSGSPNVGDTATLTAWDVQLGAGLGFRFE